MELKTKSLYDLMDAELRKLGVSPNYQSLDKFIGSDNTCAAFIRAILNDDDYEIPDQNSDIYEFAKTRAQHSVITFLMGLIFSKFAGISADIMDTIGFLSNEENITLNFLRPWMITSLYHDKGYYSKYLQNGKLDYRKTFKHYLFTDIYSEPELMFFDGFYELHRDVFAHTYDQILCYDQYARKYHARKKHAEEQLDHGILGGVIVFNDLVRNALKVQKTNSELKLAKACCLTIAQHNIFKSNSKETDNAYPAELSYLYHDSPFRIRKRNPLLLFLCLVDTLECVKRFSKGENEKNSLQTKTVLSSIYLTVNEDTIVIDYAKLHQKVDEKKNPDFSETYIKYRDGVLSLNKWTEFKTVEDKNNSDTITITLATPASLYQKVPALVGSE